MPHLSSKTGENYINRRFLNITHKNKSGYEGLIRTTFHMFHEFQASNHLQSKVISCDLREYILNAKFFVGVICQNETKFKLHVYFIFSASALVACSFIYYEVLFFIYFLIIFQIVCKIKYVEYVSPTKKWKI